MDTCSSESPKSWAVCPSLGIHGNRASGSLEPTVIAKSSILLDVKPWDDETDMAKLEECVRSVQMDGLVWGQCKYAPTQPLMDATQQ